MKQILCLLILVAGSACQSPPDHTSKVSQELGQRTGYQLPAAQNSEACLPDSINWNDGLSEDEAVTVSLWNNAAFKELLADIAVSRADLIQAGMLTNPTLSMLIPVGAKPLELTARVPLEILWLRPKRVAAAKLDYEKTAQRLVQSGLDVIRDVRLSYYDLSAAQRRLSLAEETARIAAQIGDLSRSRVRAGDASELEASTALIDQLLAEDALTRLRFDFQLASERLRGQLGLGLQSFEVQVTNQPSTAQKFSVDDCLTNALSSRPDLRAAELNLEAAGKRLGLAQAEIFTFAASLNSKEVGTEFLSGPGIDLAVPILNQNQGGRALARANLEKAARHYVAVRDKIVQEVREAHIRFSQASESYERWQKFVLPPMEEAGRQAEKAFQGGDISFLQVLETSRKITEAKSRAISADTDMSRAAAELERSIGKRLQNEKKGEAP